MRTKQHLLLAALLILAGFALMAYMIIVEDEPGAVPLLMVILGMGWSAFALFRSRPHRRQAGSHTRRTMT